MINHKEQSFEILISALQRHLDSLYYFLCISAKRAKDVVAFLPSFGSQLTLQLSWNYRAFESRDKVGSYWRVIDFNCCRLKIVPWDCADAQDFQNVHLGAVIQHFMNLLFSHSLLFGLWCPPKFSEVVHFSAAFTILAFCWTTASSASFVATLLSWVASAFYEINLRVFLPLTTQKCLEMFLSLLSSSAGFYDFTETWVLRNKLLLQIFVSYSEEDPASKPSFFESFKSTAISKHAKLSE